MKVLTAVFAILFFLIAPMAEGRDLVFQDKTIVQVPDEISQDILDREGHKIVVHNGKYFGMLALVIQEGKRVYSLLFSIEPLTERRNLVNFIGIAIRSESGAIRYCIDRSYFQGGLPDGKLVFVPEAPDLDALIQMKEAAGPKVRV
jgi:hypothetical protein